MTDYKKEWLSTKELEEEFGFSIPTQDRMRRERTVPYSKVGRNIRYSRTKINAWLEDHEIVS